MGDKTLRLAVLYSDDEWARVVIRDLEMKIKGTRIELITKQPFRAGDPIIRSVVQKVKALKPDALFVVSLGKSSATVYHEIHEAPATNEVYGFAVCHDDELFAVAKTDLEGMYGVGPRLDKKGALYERLQRTYEEERPGEPVDMTSISMFNATLILAEALKGHADTGPAMRSFVLKKETFDGIAGNVVFNSKGDAKWKASVERISGGACLPLPE